MFLYLEGRFKPIAQQRTATGRESFKLAHIRVGPFVDGLATGLLGQQLG